MKPETRSMEKIQAMAGAELSLEARLGYVGLLLVSAALTTVVVSLWLTEPSLPARTQLAFAVMSLIGVSWSVLAAWALRARRPLFARDRVIAGGLAVTFSALFVAGCLAAAILSGATPAYAAFATGVVMLAVAISMLLKARRRFAALSIRRRELEAQLGV